MIDKNIFGDYSPIKIIKYFVILFFISISFISCADYFGKAQIPHYILISDMSIKTNYPTQGSAVSDIKECWVYADGELLGAFDKNKLIPIVSDNDIVDIIIVAGIRANGSNSDIVEYFLLQPITKSIENTEGEVDTINAQFSYNENAKFLFFEGFEGTNIFTEDIDENTNTKVTTTTSQHNSGSACGRIVLDSENDEIEVTSSLDFYHLPSDGNQTFLEISYKCNNEFFVGVLGQDESSGSEYNTDVIYVVNSDEWNRMYINLTSTIYDSGLGLYKIYFYAKYNGLDTTTEIYLDDIKFLYLN